MFRQSDAPKTCSCGKGTTLDRNDGRFFARKGRARQNAGAGNGFGSPNFWRGGWNRFGFRRNCRGRFCGFAVDSFLQQPTGAMCAVGDRLWNPLRLNGRHSRGRVHGRFARLWFWGGVVLALLISDSLSQHLQLCLGGFETLPKIPRPGPQPSGPISWPAWTASARVSN